MMVQTVRCLCVGSHQHVVAGGAHWAPLWLVCGAAAVNRAGTTNSGAPGGRIPTPQPAYSVSQLASSETALCAAVVLRDVLAGLGRNKKSEIDLPPCRLVDLL
eukprot:COSAG04_NODE_2866_length_3451_cov_2.751492_2_plen_103_part_00